MSLILIRQNPMRVVSCGKEKTSVLGVSPPKSAEKIVFLRYLVEALLGIPWGWARLSIQARDIKNSK